LATTQTKQLALLMSVFLRELSSPKKGRARRKEESSDNGISQSWLANPFDAQDQGPLHAER